MSKHYRPTGKVRWQDHVLGGRTKPKPSRTVGAPAARRPGKPGQSKPAHGKPTHGKPTHGKARSGPPDADRAGDGSAVAHPIRRPGKDRTTPKNRESKPPMVGAGKSPRPSHQVSTPGDADNAGLEKTAARTPRLDGQGLPFITLAQFLKRENAAGSGGEAKAVIRGGLVQVNGQGEVRPGRKLHHGDTVVIADALHRVELPAVPGTI